MKQKPVRIKKKGRGSIITGLVLIGCQLLVLLGAVASDSPLLSANKAQALGSFLPGILGVVFLAVGFYRKSD